MCGRFSSAVKHSDQWLELMQEWPGELFNRYNVSPSTQIAAFVDGACHAMRWGLVPSWSKEISSQFATFNARIESIDEKPAFRTAWRKKQKCLIPAQGYYEWQVEEGIKQPYYVTPIDNQPIVFAGLWDECDFGGEPLKSCTIITTEAEAHLKSLHNRMPVMLTIDDAKQWLSKDNKQDEKSPLLGAKLPPLKVYKVDKRVNNSREEDEVLILPL